jgi:hypothetical protein
MLRVLAQCVEGLVAHLVGTVPGLSSLAGGAAPSVFEVSHPDPSSWQHRPPGGQPRNAIARSLITT